MKKIAKFLFVLFIFIFLTCLFFYFKYKPPAKTEWGLTFSYQEAEGLGFNSQWMYVDVLSDLKPSTIRLMTYWEDLEKVKGKYDFANVDWQIQLAEKQNVKIVLVLGRKQPRWPECHDPNWLRPLSQSDQDQALLEFVAASVSHFKNFQAIKAWQVENEPYFSFGSQCPIISKDLLRKEVSEVKKLDQRPIIITDSGERGSWIPSAKSGADIFGSTLYRVSYDSKYGGYYKYPVPAIFYRVKEGILSSFTDVSEIWDMELQMEPWFTNGALNTPLDVQKTLMNQKVFVDNLEYAKKTGFARHYLWGVEWWYYMAKKHGDWAMWTAGKELFSEK